MKGLTLYKFEWFEMCIASTFESIISFTVVTKIGSRGSNYIIRLGKWWNHKLRHMYFTYLFKLLITCTSLLLRLARDILYIDGPNCKLVEVSMYGWVHMPARILLALGRTSSLSCPVSLEHSVDYPNYSWSRYVRNHNTYHSYSYKLDPILFPHN
jgi:hypothetical protein